MAREHFFCENNPIDAVVAWVDGNDPLHRAKMETFLKDAGSPQHPGANPIRFASIGEIGFCILSIFRFAPFVRNIFVVTDQQDPKVGKLVAENFPERVKSLKIIDHKEIFSGFEQYLPTFNSISIETMLWRIPGLANNYIYFNDDTFLIRPTIPEDWFVNDKPVIRGAWNLAPYPRIIYDKSRKFIFGKLFGKVGYQPRHSFQVTQWLSAKMVGYGLRFFLAGHTPHPIKRELIEQFFVENPAFLEMNASSRFREYKQFNIAALSNHLELKTGNANLRKTDIAYLQPLNRDRNYVKRKIEFCKNNSNIKFMCVQALDACTESTQKEVLGWLERTIKN